MDIDERLAIVKAQEELLKFESFTAEDAWELGKLIVGEAMDLDLKVAISIRSSSGKLMFHYALEGTSGDNDHWIEKKYNVVRRFERSTIALQLELQKGGLSVIERGLEYTSYGAHGGGFPIFVEGVGVVAAVVASGLPDAEDHDLIVRCLARYLDVEGVPRYPLL
jgi:uncharacterized protein (UPF0303 family)